MSLINPRNLDNSVKPAKTVKYLFICMTKRIHFYLVCKKKKAFKKAKYPSNGFDVSGIKN